MTMDDRDIPTGLPKSYWYSASGQSAKQPTIVKADEIAVEQPTVNGVTMKEKKTDHVTVKEVTSNAYQTPVEFWRNALAGSECSPYPTLPPFVDQPKADKEVEYQFSQPRELFEGISTSTLVRAAWALITSSITDSEDVVFGSAASRGDAAIPVRIKLNVNQKVQGYLKEVQQQAIQAIPYEQVGLDQIAKASTDCQKACTFQTVLVQSQGDSLLRHFGNYCLTIQIQLVGGQINAHASFDSRVIEQFLVFKMLRRLEFVMQQLNSATPEGALNELEIVPPPELDQIREWNSGVPPVVERCIHDIVKERAQADPEAQAVCAWDGELTYRQLDDLSSHVASHLVHLGVGPEKVIPLCFEKSMWTVVAMLSVLKASGTFILLDPGLPEGRVRSIIQKVQAETAITSTSCQNRLAHFVQQTVVLSKEAMQLLKSQSQLLPSQMPKAVPSNAAYIIFTSGSTGEPKGCVVEHRSYCSAAFGHGKVLGLSKNTRALQFGSYNFAGAIMEMVMTMIYGGCICIPSEEDRSVNLARIIGKLNANWAFLTSTVLALLHPEDVPSLRTICIGGEPIRSSQIREWAPKVRLRQTYGSAETAAVVSSAGLDSSSVVTSVGKATTCRCWLASPTNTNQLVPIGAPGEVVLEGPAIGRHYIGNPRKTAEAFIKAPSWRGAFGPVAASSRFYRTGDIALYRSDGSLELLGRKDTQVKLRGQRIELGEIEHQARQSSPDLKEVAVELTALGDSGPRLVGFLVLKSSQANGDGIILDQRVKSVIHAVKSRLESVLPHYMVPSVLLPIPSLPLTASGKTDRRILRQMGSAVTAQQILDLQPKSEWRKRQPSTQTEKQLQKIWSKVLKIDPATIGLDVSFFQIGGDSVSAMKVVSEARTLGMNLNVADVFRQDTLEGLAQQQSLNAEEAPRQLDGAVLVEPSVKSTLLEELESNFGLSSADVVDIYPLTGVQETLVTASVALGPMADYFYLDLDACLDVTDLERGCMRALEKFPILRARFLQLQGKYWQVVPHRLGEAFRVYNVVGDLEEYFRNFCLENVKSILPTQAPAAFLLFMHDKGMRLTVRWSHAQYDAFSAPLVFQSIFDGDQGEIPAKPTFPMFLSYAAHQRPQSLAYWRQLLQESHLTPIGPYVRSGNSPNAMPEQVLGAAEARLPHCTSKITHATLVRAAWAVLLSSMSGETDVIYGQVVAGRNAAIPSVEKIVGCCLNTLPERVDFSSVDTVAELVHSVQEQYLSIGDADSLDCKDIIEYCTDWPAGSTFDTILHHRNVDEEPAIQTPTGISRMKSFKNPLISPFIFVVSASRGENVGLELCANTHIMDLETAKAMVSNLARIMEKLVTGMHMALPEWMDEVNSLVS
ncbi:nonribosomal peptide synthase [Aspergillus viridinutans]|uniref:Nonribosomal peptide synthase n=1 Tax=Aspergillus viridinutans TaxID=75553 RepID=A0A9P3BWI7_ASPVI|nr:nonribosomal peptide synthase [Aspergillus viridinutans]GIK03803.1 nonribosomal peptide synthase [Aspergillus viridinutans]